ncbi:unnamed protein product [Urochloa humidicola]
MAKGDPHTRPDVETVFVPSSFDLERDARDWESCALVPWAIYLPRGDGARAIEELLTEQLDLRRGDITITVHQPEPYLIRFESSEHCTQAKEKGRFTGHSIDICLRQWRSLTHALGMRIFYRVRLCLDGIPTHAWTPEIVERVIGNRCVLQCINTDLVQPRDTRHIDLWAWTADPSDIPRRVWLIFTHRPSERSSAVFISAVPPESWHQGARFQVFIHMPVVEDYSAVANNLQNAIANPSSIVPIRRTYTWRYGLVDGAPPGARSTFPARLPRPPREQEDRRHDAPNRDVDRADGRGRSVRGERESGEARKDRAVRDRRSGQDGTARRRTGRSSCKEQSFTWPATREDDDDDDYDHPGRGHDAPSGFCFFSLAEEEPVQRERTRSPRRRDGAFWRRAPLEDDHPPHRAGDKERDDEDDLPPAPGMRVDAGAGIPSEAAQHSTPLPALQQLLAAHASALNCCTNFLMGNKVRRTHQTSPLQLRSYERSTREAHQWAAHGEAAWSGSPPAGDVPAGRVFTRLKESFPPPSVQEVEAALNAMLCDPPAPMETEAVAAVGAVARTTAATASPTSTTHRSPPMGLEEDTVRGLVTAHGPASPPPSQQDGQEATDWASPPTSA